MMLAHSKHTMCVSERNEISALLIFQLKHLERKYITASKARAEIPKPVCLVPGACIYMWHCLVLSPTLPYSHVYQFCVELRRRLSSPSSPFSTAGRGDTVSWLLFPHSPSIHYLPVLQIVPSQWPRSEYSVVRISFLGNSTCSDKSSPFVVPSLLLFYFLTQQCLDFPSTTWALENHKGEKIHL